MPSHLSSFAAEADLTEILNDSERKEMMTMMGVSENTRGVGMCVDVCSRSFSNQVFQYFWCPYALGRSRVWESLRRYSVAPFSSAVILLQVDRGRVYLC